MKNNNRNSQDRINQAENGTPSTSEGLDHLDVVHKGVMKEGWNDEEEVAASTESKAISAEIAGNKKRTKLNKRWKIFGIIALAIGIFSIVFMESSSVDKSESAQNALKNKVSTVVAAGVILLKDDENIGAQDYTITHQSNEEKTKIWIWDYAAEDGDYVQVIVNGTPISEPFMIMHKPREMTVPTVGTLQIKGIRDGGGGITYAVRYDVNGTSYFNSAPEGDFNTYELVRE